MTKPQVLILCTGNSCRSQMAEGALRSIAGDRLNVFSAGTDPQPIHPLAIQVMQEIRVDISGQQSNHVDKYLGESLAYVVTVCSNADENCPAHFVGAPQRMHWPFEDPAKFKGTQEETLVQFRKVRDQIVARFEQWVAEV